MQHLKLLFKHHNSFFCTGILIKMLPDVADSDQREACTAVVVTEFEGESEEIWK